MSKSKRISMPLLVQQSVKTKSHDVCCVCKERGIGVNLHHVDGNPANNHENNIAVLCVKEHDQHHRPNAYNKSRHLELDADTIRKCKVEWEHTVAECKSNSPRVLAVVNAFGSEQNIHSVKFLPQNLEGGVIYERLFRQHEGDMNDWTDWILEEVVWLGKNIKLNLIDKPLPVSQCPCCKKSFSTTVNNNVALRLSAADWQQESVGTVYINPTAPSCTLGVFYFDKIICEARIHKCGNRLIKFSSDDYEEETKISKKVNIEKQVDLLINDFFNFWQIQKVFIGKGAAEAPVIMAKLKLPGIWNS